jgi:hypothetical protein
VAILGDRMLELFDRADLSRRGEVTLPAARRGWQIGQGDGTGAMVLTDGSRDRPDRLFVLSPQAVLAAGTADLGRVAIAYEPGDDRDWRLSAEALWRIDRRLVLHRCAIAAGRAAPRDCTPQTRPPDILDPDTLSAATVLPTGDHLVLSAGAVLRIGSEWRIVDRTEVPQATGTARFVEDGGVRFLWTGQGGDLWRFADSAAPERVLRGVLDLRKLPDALFATTSEGAFLLQGMAAPAPPRAGDIPLRAATSSTRDIIEGLGPDGLLRRRGQAEPLLSDIVLPDGILAAAAGPAPKAAALAKPGAVWAQHADGQVRIHWMGRCPLPLPAREAARGPGDAALPPDAGPGAAATVQDGATPVVSQPADAAPDPAAGPASGDAATTTEPAPEPAAEPGPGPGPSACAQVLDTGLTLAGTERMLQVRDGPAVEVDTTGATYGFSGEMLHDGRRADRVPGVPQAARALSDIRGMIRVIDGTPYLAPPDLRGSGGRFDVARRPEALQSQIGGRLAQSAPLTLPSLAWDSVAKGVKFADGPVLPAAEAIRDGRFLPDAPGRTAYLGGESYALLNPHGLWRVRIGREAVPVRIAASDMPTDLAGGRFLSDTDGVDARTGARGGDSGRASVTRGALRVTETLRGGALAAHYTVGNTDVPALATSGFAFDRRQGITVEGGTPLLLTPIGLVPAAGLGPGAHVPAGTVGVDAEGAASLAWGPGGWSRRTTQGWIASAPPWHDRILADGPHRRWERRAGAFGIVALADADAYAVARQGLNFEADRLRALAATPRGIVAILGIGTVEAASLSALATLTPPTAPDPVATGLETRDVSPGRPILGAETAQGRRVWDHGARAWRAPAQGEDPWTFRTAVDNGGLRLAFRQAQPLASVQVEDLGGAQRYAEFGWIKGQDMPFDRVRGFAVEGDRVLLATDLGLRRLGWSGQGAVSRAVYSGVASGVPLAFDRVGRPAAEPARILATAGSACFELASPDAPPQPCVAPGGLQERAIPSAPLWDWHKTDAAIHGIYLDRSGQPVGPVRLGAGGRWPHDTLRSVAQCDGTLAELWAEDDVVARAGAGLPGQLQRLAGVEALWCQDVPAELGQASALAPGFLAAGGNGAWRLAAPGWQPQAHADAILDRARGLVPWEAARLRLRLEGRRAVQEVRGLDDIWRPIPWDGDRPSIDRVTGIAGVGPTLRLLTPAGVLDWSFAGQRLDPATVTLRTPKDRSALADCRPARIEARDGSVQAVPPLPGAPVDILCDDGRVWRGNPAAAADAGVLVPAASDIRADRVLVRAGGWVWTRRITASGAQSLSIAFRTEAVSLDAGRLSLDDYAGLAAPYADHVEIVTQGAGWWRYPQADLSMTAARRPPPGSGAETATALHADVVDGAPRLCVQGQDAVIFEPSGGVARAAGCRDVRGADATYTWHSGPGGAAADGIALNGLALRRSLTGGRFGDLFVTGAPAPDAQGRILAPTRAGVVVIGPSGPEGIHAKADPAFLAPDAGGLPLALGAAGAMPLSGADRPACAALADLPARLPGTARVLRWHPVSSDAVEVLVAFDSGGRLPLMVPCASLADTLTWSLPLDVADRGRFRAIGADGVAARLVASLDLSQILLASQAGRGVTLDTGLTGQPVAQVVAPDARAVIVATDRALYRLDTDRALSGIARSGPTDIPGAKGPFAPIAAPREATQPQPPAGPVPAPPQAMQPQPAAGPVPAPPQATAPGVPRPPLAPPVLDDTVPLALTVDDWREVQRALKARGLYPGAIDGIAGPRTLAGLRAWQAATGRPETGVLTERQKTELIVGSR